MCGITGVAALRGAPLSIGEDRLRTMCGTIYHRGPDDEGREIRESVALGMRRLAIIDLSGGGQPIFNEDRTVRTVFNGEIYNFRELRRDLEALGHRFETAADTEVLVHAYESYGDSFPERLNGMFAFAIHDSRNQRLLLVRDHLGIKPLYYAFVGDSLVWGSEIKCLLASGLVPRRLATEALAEFLTWEYVPGTHTLFEGIFQLDPGQMLVVDLRSGQYAIQTFWDVPGDDEDSALSEEAWIEAVDEKLRECVRRQMISDVPLGAFLSGGVDSSLVVAAMARAQTFSIGFDDPSYNELSWAREVAEHLGVDHSDAVIRPDILSLFDDLMYHMDDPIGDFSIFPTYLVSSHARNQVTVSLSGDGGDELFGGYETYVAQDAGALYDRLPGWVRSGVVSPLMGRMKPRPEKKGLVNKALRFVEGAAYDPGLGHCRWRKFLGDRLRGELFTPEAAETLKRPVDTHIHDLFRRARGRDPLNQLLYVDLKSYLSDNCLVKVDRMSMAVSLEARVPFLDPELVSLAFRVPRRFKVDRGKTKRLLKRVAERHLPRNCVYRPKEGFSIPIKHWLNTTLRPVADRLLNPERLKREGLFRPDTVERLRREHAVGVANHSHLLWSLMVFQAWRDRWLEGDIG